MALVDSFDSENWQNVHTLISLTVKTDKMYTHWSVWQWKLTKCTHTDQFDSENWQNVHTLISFTTSNAGKTGLQLYKTPLQDNRVSSNDIQNAPQDAEVHIIIIDTQVHLVINRKLPVQVQGNRNLYIRTQYGCALLILYMAVIFDKCGSPDTEC